MSKKNGLEFRPSLLSDDHKGFVAALTTDEYNKRRRLVTEAALTELGSTTSAFSNYHPNAHRYRMRDITCDAEGPRRGFILFGRQCLTGIACLVIVVFGISVLQASYHTAEVLQEPEFIQSKHGVSVSQTELPECPARETVTELADAVTPLAGDQAADHTIVQQVDATVYVPSKDASSLSGSHQQNTESLSPQNVVPPLPVTCQGDETDSSWSETLSPGSVTRAADVPYMAALARICTSSSNDVDLCMATDLLDTVCLPTIASQQLAQERTQQVDMPQQPDQLQQLPRPLEMPQQVQKPQQPELMHETDPSRASNPSERHHQPVGHQDQDDVTVPTFRAAWATPSAPEHLPHSAGAAPPAPGASPPVLKHTDSAPTPRLLDQLDALLSSRDVTQFFKELRVAAAHPHGSLVMWAAVLTPLLSIFATCFAVSVLLHVARVVLGTLANVCSASSHFTMQRLGTITRQLMPLTQRPPEEMVMLELQASVAKSEADCRAKDEQLASLKLLLNGLQLELQRCSDAEKDLTAKYNEELARMRKHNSRHSDRARSDSSSRSTQIPGPAPELAAPRSLAHSAFSDTDSDGGAATGRLQVPAAPATVSPSAVPGPPRLGRISAAAACSARTAQAQRYANTAVTPLSTPLSTAASDAASPSSDHSEAGFAACTTAPLRSESAGLC